MEGVRGWYYIMNKVQIRKILFYIHIINNISFIFFVKHPKTILSLHLQPVSTKLLHSLNPPANHCKYYFKQVPLLRRGLGGGTIL
jgi:hypothetical protein